MEHKFDCPVCGKPLVHIRGWNEKIFGTNPEKNPFIGYICENRDCKGWLCDNCGVYHPYGTSCISPHNYNELSDPNWHHREEDLFENKYGPLLKFMRERK